MAFFTTIQNKIKVTPVYRFIIRSSKKKSLPGFNGIPIYDVVNFFIGQVRTIGMTERASAISYNFFMAIPPAIIFLFTLIPYIPISSQFQQQMF